jgi:hypothetical protein
VLSLPFVCILPEVAAIQKADIEARESMRRTVRRCWCRCTALPCALTAAPSSPLQVRATAATEPVVLVADVFKLEPEEVTLKKKADTRKVQKELLDAQVARDGIVLAPPRRLGAFGGLEGPEPSVSSPPAQLPLAECSAPSSLITESGCSTADSLLCARRSTRRSFVLLPL